MTIHLPPSSTRSDQTRLIPTSPRLRGGVPLSKGITSNQPDTRSQRSHLENGGICPTCDRDHSKTSVISQTPCGMDRFTQTLKRRYLECRVHAPITMSPVNLLPGAISEILASVAETGVLTLADRYGLMAAALDESLDEEDRSSLNRLLRAVLKGRVRVVEQLSIAA